VNLLCLLLGSASLTFFGLGLHLIIELRALREAVTKAGVGISKEISGSTDILVLPETERPGERAFQKRQKAMVRT